MTTQITPIFLLSLQRSGSTLLQRLLASHAEIASTAEPWLLIPFVYGLKNHGIFAEYNHWALTQAFSDFIEELPKSCTDYYEEIRKCISALYQKAAKPGAIYFLDKSPVYCFIAKTICDIFPDARFLFLWRNPLAIAASWLRAYDEGRWRISYFERELLVGLPNLIECYNKLKHNVLAVRYEDMVLDPQYQLIRVSEFLGIEFRSSMLKDFESVTFAGSMGDPGRDNHCGIEQSGLRMWPTVYWNPFRRSWARRYMQSLGEDRLDKMGYDINEIIANLNGMKGVRRSLCQDMILRALDRISVRGEERLWAEQRPR